MRSSAQHGTCTKSVAVALVFAMLWAPAVSNRGLLRFFTVATAQAQTVTSTTFTYDDNGNVLSRTTGSSTDTFSYDAENRLISANLQTGPSPGLVTYIYDDDGMRTAKSAGGLSTSFLLDKNRDYAQAVVETSGSTITSYTYGNHLISQTRTGVGSRFYLSDGPLSARQLTSSVGAVTDSYTYDGFGALLASTEAAPNNYRFTGEQFEPNLGSYYLRARYYDQGTGRFMAADPVSGRISDPASLHPYMYAADDPVNKVDPSGEFLPVVVFAVGLLGVVVGAYQFLTGPRAKQAVGGRNHKFSMMICSGGQFAPLGYGVGWKTAIIAENGSPYGTAKYTLFSYGLGEGIGVNVPSSAPIKFETRGTRDLRDFEGTGYVKSAGVSAIVAGLNGTIMTLAEGTEVPTDTGFGFGLDQGAGLSVGAVAMQVDWDLVDRRKDNYYLLNGHLFCK